jgi:hypothetical protein
MKTAALALAGIALVAGLLSAWHWWKSSKTSFQLTTTTLITSGSPVITARDLERYLQEVGGLNARAAIFGAISVTLAAVSGVLGAG